jgi:hypothetical protein
MALKIPTERACCGTGSQEQRFVSVDQLDERPTFAWDELAVGVEEKVLEHSEVRWRLGAERHTVEQSRQESPVNCDLAGCVGEGASAVMDRKDHRKGYYQSHNHH